MKLIGLLDCLHDQKKSGPLKRPDPSNQSKQFEKYTKSSIWPEKSRPPKAIPVPTMQTGYIRIDCSVCEKIKSFYRFQANRL